MLQNIDKEICFYKFQKSKVLQKNYNLTTEKIQDLLFNLLDKR